MINNLVNLVGIIDSEITINHKVEETFYGFVLKIPRLSGMEDLIPVIVSENLVKSPNGMLFNKGDKVFIKGEYRSYNQYREGSKSKLILNVFVLEIFKTNDDFMNEIQLEGTICKPVIYRVTPAGREISDIFIAVNRKNKRRSDYIPCLAWGRVASYTNKLEVGTRISLKGRIQSRKYTKTYEDGSIEEKVAYEVSSYSVIQVVEV